MRVPFNFLDKQFSETEVDVIWQKIRPVVLRGDFTLGAEVAAFEEAYAAKTGCAYAIGVGNGTDALALPIKALGITGEIVCPAFTFFASAGAIVQAGAKPVFADIGDDMNLDASRVEEYITPNTEAILPVMWGGRPCDMHVLKQIASRHGLALIGDCAQALGSKWDGKPVGSYCAAAGYSLHPLKLVQGWGDGGVIVTQDSALDAKLRRMRNHGMVNRDIISDWGVNSRLDTIQAVVAHHVLASLDDRIAQRRRFASYLTACLQGTEANINLIPDHPWAYCNYYLFSFNCLRRSALYVHLQEQGIDCKCHYPLPLHTQDPARRMGYKQYDFPKAENTAAHTISLPCHEYLDMEAAPYIAKAIKDFYK